MKAECKVVEPGGGDPVASLTGKSQSTLVMGSTGCIAASLLLLLVASAHAGTGIADLFSWGLDYIGTEAKSDASEPSLAARDCSCEGPTCNCCVNFNISFIDLGGPGCVKLKYLSQAEGLMVNVSYGDNVLHSEQVKGSKPQPACMDLLSNLAQVCARFTELTPEGEGLRGCTLLEPTLLGDVQAQYPVGCFRMGPFGMILDPEREPVVTTSEVETAEEVEEEEEVEESSTDKPNLSSEEALINAVNESAEEGIAWFTSLLGLSFGGGNGTAAAAEAEDPTPNPTTTPQRQRSFNAIPLK